MRRLLLLTITSVLSFISLRAEMPVTLRDSVQQQCYKAKHNIDTLERLLSRYQHQRNAHAQGLVLSAIGKAYNLQSEYTKAIGSYQQAVMQLKLAHAETDLITALTSLATNCRRIGAYANASEHLFNALALASQEPLKHTPERLKQQSYIYNGLGNVYKYLDDGVQAEEYFRKAIVIDKELQNNLGIAMNYTTLGSIYEHRSMPDSAKKLYTLALEYDKAANSIAGVGICYNRIGHLFYHQQELDSAYFYYLQAHELLSKSKDSWNLARSALSLGQILVKQKKYNQAIPYIEESIKLVAGRHSFGFESEIHYCLSRMYEQQGLYEQALAEHKLCLAYSDSAASQRSDQDVAHNRLRFEQDQFNVEMQKADTMITRQRYIIMASFVLGLIILGLTILLLRLLSTTRKYNKTLKQANDIKNKFFSIISHDLKNPVGAQKATIDMLVQNFEALSTDDLRRCLIEFQRSSASLLNLLLDLLEWSRLNTGQIQHNPCPIDLYTTTSDVMEQLQESAQNKNISLNNHISPSTIVWADRNITATVLRNLLNNAIKFSHPNSCIDIRTAQAANGRRTVSVQDYGVGIAPNALQTLFNPLHKSQRGTNGETGTGLGLTVCQEMLALEHTTLKVQSELGQGSTFYFELPPPRKHLIMSNLQRTAKPIQNTKPNHETNQDSVT